MENVVHTLNSSLKEDLTGACAIIFVNDANELTLITDPVDDQMTTITENQLTESIDKQFTTISDLNEMFQNNDVSSSTDKEESDPKSQESGLPTCEICGKSFTKMKGYNKHMRKIHKVFRRIRGKVTDEDLTCNVCEKKFICRSNRNSHIKLVHNLDGSAPVLQCQYCDYQSIVKATFQRHVVRNHLAPKKPKKIVDENREFPCETCGKTFKWKENLNKHVNNVHFPKKFFHCDKCDFKSPCKAVYKRHVVRKHLAKKPDRPHKCTLCDSSFKEEAYLKRHEQRIHNIQFTNEIHKKKCPHCPFTSKQLYRNEIIAHLRETHHIPLTSEKLLFTDLESLREWKTYIEQKTNTRYRGDLAVARTKWHNCNRSGFYDRSKKTLQTTELCSTIKINAFCPAAFHVQILESGNLEVEYWPVHVGHTTDEYNQKKTFLKSTSVEVIREAKKMKLTSDPEANEILTQKKVLENDVQIITGPTEEVVTTGVESNYVDNISLNLNYKNLVENTLKINTSNVAVDNNTLKLNYKKLVEGTLNDETVLVNNSLNFKKLDGKTLNGETNNTLNIEKQVGETSNATMIDSVKVRKVSQNPLWQTQYKCGHCSCTFTNRLDCHQHIRTHVTPCSFCSKTFLFKESLQRHIDTEHLPNDYSCEHCDYKTTHKHSMQAHLRQHIAEGKDVEIRVFHCEHCEKRFKTRSQLQTHVDCVHFPQNHYKCGECDFASPLRASLRRHYARRHIRSTRPKQRGLFQCLLCSMSYNEESELRQHEQRLHLIHPDKAGYKIQTKQGVLHNSSHVSPKNVTQSKINENLDTTTPDSNDVIEILDDNETVFENTTNGEEVPTINDSITCKTSSRNDVTANESTSNNGKMEKQYEKYFKQWKQKRTSSRTAENDRELSDLMWIHNMKNNSETGMFYFKPATVISEKFPLLKPHDYLLIYMSETQKYRFTVFGNKTVFIDKAYNIRVDYNLHLYTLLVVDDAKNAYPAAFMLTNRRDDEVLSVLFEKIQDDLGRVIPETFISDFDDSVYSIWCKLMGPAKSHAYSSRHVLRAWKRNLVKIESKDSKGRVFSVLSRLLCEKDKVTFHKLLDDVEKSSMFENEAFFQYFRDDFLRDECYKKWASCYVGSSDLEFSLESFVRVLKQCYIIAMGAEGGVLRLILETFTNQLDDWSNENKMAAERKVMMIKKKHNFSLVVSRSSLRKINDHTWVVLPSSDNQEFHLVRKIATCSTCELVCVKCDTCLHEYVCSCRDNAMRYNMCVHVHLVARGLLKPDTPVCSLVSVETQEGLPTEVEVVEEEGDDSEEQEEEEKEKQEKEEEEKEKQEKEKEEKEEILLQFEEVIEISTDNEEASDERTLTDSDTNEIPDDNKLTNLQSLTSRRSESNTFDNDQFSDVILFDDDVDYMRLSSPEPTKNRLGPEYVTGGGGGLDQVDEEQPSKFREVEKVVKEEPTVVTNSAEKCDEFDEVSFEDEGADPSQAPLQIGNVRSLKNIFENVLFNPKEDQGLVEENEPEKPPKFEENVQKFVEFCQKNARSKKQIEYIKKMMQQVMSDDDSML